MEPRSLGDILAGQKPPRPTSEPRRYRHGALYLDAGQVRNALDRNDRARLLVIAEGIERRTKHRGRHGGAIGRCGLIVLRQLLFRFCGADGRCFPALKTLAAACAMSLQAVVSALRRLEALGLVRRVQRLRRTRVTRISPWTGLVETFIGTLQASNAYLFANPTGGEDLLAPPATGRVALPAKRQATLAGLFAFMKPTPNHREEPQPPSYSLPTHTFPTATRG